jgi:hypothetical protein
MCYRRILFSVGALLTLVAQISAATIVVDIHGGGDFTTIQAALNAAANGDTIEVWPGVYTENNLRFPKTTPATDLVLRGRDGPAATIIDGGGDPAPDTFQTSDRVFLIDGGQTTATVIEGFTIRHGVRDAGASANNFGAGVYILNSSPTIRGNWLHSNYTSSGGGGICGEGFYGIIEQNRIYRNRAHYGSGIRIMDSPHGITIVRNNLIYDNIVRAGLFGPPQGQGIRIDSSSVLLVNNVICQNTTNESPSLEVIGGGICLLPDATGTVIRNCIVRGNGTAGSWEPNIYGFSSGAWYCNNLEYSPLSGDGNFNKDPEFIDAANWDFHIAPTSPCIDAGDSTDAPDADFDGNARVDDPDTVNTGIGVYPYYDVGAYEYVLTNRAPAAEDDSVATDEDVPVDVYVLVNDTDPDGDDLTVESVTDPTYGTAIISNDSTYVIYTPDDDWNGVDSFTYTVSDGNGGTDTATVTVTVNPVNDPPVAEEQAVATDEDTPVEITLVANDVDGDTLTYEVLTQPANGFLSGTAPNLTYTPNEDYFGPDSFTFKVNDGTVDSNTATVTITVNPVNDPPVAEEQAVATDEDTPVEIALVANDVDGDTLTYAVLTQPANGVLSGTAPNLTYTPNEDYFGPDSFTFKANDGTVDSNTATVTITVNPVNDPPVAEGQAVATDEDTPVEITLVANDVDGDTLTYEVLTQPTNGVLSGTAPNLTYTPNEDYFGPDGFTFKANDGTVDSNTATVTITVNPVNDPPVAEGQAVATDEDTPVEITLVANDVDGDTLTYEVLTQPGNGVLSGTAPNLTYTPNADYFGPDSFTFKANDGTVDSNTAIVTITVNPVNDPPVAEGQAVATDEDTPVEITLVANDVDGDTLTYAVLTQPANGVLSGTTPNLTYTPNADYFGPDSFTFKANDGTMDSNTATVTITVNPVNDPPVAEDQAVVTDEDTPVEITLVANDVDGDTLTYEVLSQPANGVLSGTAPNLTYTPNADYFGPDSFTFKVNDGTVDSNTATVTITVNPVNDPPVAEDRAVATDEDTPVEITLVANDVDGDTLTYEVLTQPANGVLSGTAPNLTYTPNADYFGPDSFTFKANDGTVDSNTATVSITVTPVNDIPIAQDQNVTTAEDTPVAITLVAIDIEGQALTYAIVDPPAHGLLSGEAPDLVYTPAADYFGEDEFTFTASDGIDTSNIATVFITVTPENDAPVAVADTYVLAEGATLEVEAPGVLGNDIDVDEDTLRAVLVETTQNGTLNLNEDGSFSYQPNPGFNGTDTFTYRADDGMALSEPATVSIEVSTLKKFKRADANADGATDIGDAVWILNYLFRGGRAPTCLETANVNRDEVIDLADVIYILQFLFSDGAPPAAPFEECGTHPAAVGAQCIRYEPCEGR